MITEHCLHPIIANNHHCKLIHHHVLTTVNNDALFMPARVEYGKSPIKMVAPSEFLHCI